MWTSQYVARSSDAHASYPVFVHRLARLLHASFRPRLQTSDLAAAIALAFCYPSPPSGWEEDFHLQAVEHAQHTTKSTLQGLFVHIGLRIRRTKLTYERRANQCGLILDLQRPPSRPLHR